MRQETHIIDDPFQTITTLETECCHCHRITRHVAHATSVPPYDKGFTFLHSGPSKGVSFLDYERIIQAQSNAMSRMCRAHKEREAELKTTICVLEQTLEVVRQK